MRQGPLPAVGLDQPADHEVVVGRREHLQEQLRVVVLPVEPLLLEEREAHEVAGAEDDEVDVDARPVGEHHAVGVEVVDVVLRRDVALADVVDELLVDDRVRLEELVVGLLEAELREVADRDRRATP